MGRNVFIYTSSLEGFDLLELGDGCFLSPNCTIRVVNFYNNGTVGLHAVRLGRFCVIQYNTVLNYGVYLGDHCSVKHFSTVQGHVPDHSIWEGNLIRQDPEAKKRRQSSAAAAAASSPLAPESVNNQGQRRQQKKNEKLENAQPVKAETGSRRVSGETTGAATPNAPGDVVFSVPVIASEKTKQEREWEELVESRQSLSMFYQLGQFLGMGFITFIYVQPIAITYTVYYNYVSIPNADLIFYILIPMWMLLWNFLQGILLIPVVRFVVGKTDEGNYALNSFTYLRKGWFNRVMFQFFAGSLELFSYTSFQTHFLRLCGAKIGPNVEIIDILSTSFHSPFNLITLGEGCFLTGHVCLGPMRVEEGQWRVAPVKLDQFTFCGNGALLDGGVVLGGYSLVASITYVAPHSVFPESSILMGTPAQAMSFKGAASGSRITAERARESNKSWKMRLIITIASIILPKLAFALSVGVAATPMIFILLNQPFSLWLVFCCLPILYIILFFPFTALILLTKRCTVGTEKEGTIPFGSTAFFAIYCFNKVCIEFMMWCGKYLEGTEYACIISRMLGAKVGKNVVLAWGLANIQNHDLVEVGDNVVLDYGASVQPHTFEDRLWKMAKITVGSNTIMGSGSLMFPGSELGDYVHLEANSLVMRGDKIPSATRWIGNPIHMQSGNPQYFQHNQAVWDEMALTHVKQAQADKQRYVHHRAKRYRRASLSLSIMPTAQTLASENEKVNLDLMNIDMPKGGTLVDG